MDSRLGRNLLAHGIALLVVFTGSLVARRMYSEIELTKNGLEGGPYKRNEAPAQISGSSNFDRSTGVSLNDAKYLPLELPRASETTKKPIESEVEQDNGPAPAGPEARNDSIIIRSPSVRMQLPASCQAWLANRKLIRGLDRNRVTQEMKSKYDKINRMLVIQVESESAGDNLIAANKMLHTLAEAREAIRPRTQWWSWFIWTEQPDELYETALCWFTALNDLMDPDKVLCDTNEFDILVRNERATGVKVLVPCSVSRAERRIEAVIHEVAKTHADMCRSRYPAFFKQVRTSNKVSTIKEINFLMRKMIDSSSKVILHDDELPLPRWQHMLHLSQKAADISMKEHEKAKAVLGVLRKLLMDSDDRKFLHARPERETHGSWVVDEDKVRELINKLIFKRCANLDELAGEILAPADYEQQLYDDKHKYRANNDEAATFLLWLEYYRICKRMMLHQSTLKSNVIEMIWKDAEDN